MSPQDKARLAVEAARAAEDADDELEEELEEQARSTKSAVRPIRDVSDRLVFRFEVGPAILVMLLEKLKRIPLMPLLDALDAPYPGFYQLFLEEKPKYIGKTARPVGQRLSEHVSKLYGRKGIDLAKMQCRYAFVEDPSLVDVAEGALISFFAKQGLADWNASGFGSKVTGHGRGGQKASKWSVEYPPDLSLLLTVGSGDPISVAALAGQIIKDAPITLSVPKAFRTAFREDHHESISVPIASLPFEKWVELLERRLAYGWRIDRKPEGWYIVRA